MERIIENLIKESLMNIRFLAQSEYFNGIHIKDDIILEKEYEQGRFTNLPRVRYYLYYLEENVRKEVMPHSEKVDVFELTDCQYEPEYLYFTEIDDMLDGRQTFNIIKYNITDHTHTKIISLKDNMELYPDQKQIKIFILDDSNLIIQRATLKEFESGYKEFFNYSHLLFNFVKNKQIPISDENIAHNGIDYMFPFNETSCVMKTGNSLFKHNRHDRISKVHAAFRLSGAGEHTAGLGTEREHMAGRHQILGADVVGHGGEDGAGAVGRRNAGGHAVAGFDGHREVGAELGAVTLRHEREIQLVHEAGAERKADEAAGVFRHEINGLGRHMLGGDGDVTLVFPIFVVDKNDHPALPDILHRFFNTANSHSIESSASLILRKSRFRAGIQPTVSPFSPPRRRGRGGEPSCGGHTCR